MNVVSRYMQQPRDIHWKAAKRTLQYIQGTKTYDIHYAADSELELVRQIQIGWEIILIESLIPDMYSCLVVAPFDGQAKNRLP